MPLFENFYCFGGRSHRLLAGTSGHSELLREEDSVRVTNEHHRGTVMNNGQKLMFSGLSVNDSSYFYQICPCGFYNFSPYRLFWLNDNLSIIFPILHKYSIFSGYQKCIYIKKCVCVGGGGILHWKSSPLRIHICKVFHS